MITEKGDKDFRIRHTKYHAMICRKIIFVSNYKFVWLGVEFLIVDILFLTPAVPKLINKLFSICFMHV